MAVRLSTKPDASFFRKIVVGAVGARAVIRHLGEHGHEFIELERGASLELRDDGGRLDRVSCL